MLSNKQESIMINGLYTVATIFENLDNVHLIKDPGMIPYSLHVFFGFKSTILFSSEKNYDYKEELYKDIETPIIRDNDNILHNKVARLLWLIKNAKQIDLLHLFFFERWTWIYIYFYKLFNPDGLIYVHVDTDGTRLLDYEYPDNPLKLFIIKRILLKDSNIKDVLWGIQNKENAEKLKGKWPFVNLEFVPNGTLWLENIDIPFCEKENTILTVARIGSPEKNTDMLMSVFAQIADDYPDWKLKLIGNVEESFKGFIRDYFVKYPNLKNRVEFPGNISDRRILEREYAKAKVFALPSSYEGFSLSAVEALSRGCVIIGSDIPSVRMITDNERMGFVFRNGDACDFNCRLRYMLDNPELMQKISADGTEYAKINYTWKNSVSVIYEWFIEKRKHIKSK